MKKITLLFFCLISLTTMAQPGSIDATFNPGGAQANGAVLSTLRQPDGKILIAGEFTAYNGVTRNGVARLLEDGTLDTTFNPGTGIAGGYNFIYSVAVLSDGRVAIAGSFTSFNGVPRASVALLHADGTLDTSFNAGTGPGPANTDYIVNVSVQSDNKLILTGTFHTFNGVTKNTICRLNTDGSFDAGFNMGNGAGSLNPTTRIIWTSAIQPDGKILIAGGFLEYNGTAITRVARLNIDGTLDNTFSQPGTGLNNLVEKVLVQPDGKIVIGGQFTNYNNTGRNRIVRLNADGTLDSAFTAISNASGTVSAMALQSDGKLVIGGLFTNYMTVASRKIARINTDGSLDTTFNVGTGFNLPSDANIYSITSLPDNKFIVGGYFTNYNGTTQNNITKLKSANNVMVSSLSPASPFCPGQSLTLNYTTEGTFSAGNTFTAELSDANGSFATPITIGNATATTSGSIAIAIPSETAAGTDYRIRIVTSNPAITGPDNGTSITVLAQTIYFADNDNDGFGDANNSLSACSMPEGYVINNTDCDDENDTVYPGAPEIPYNLIDENCNNVVDEGFPPLVSTVNACGLLTSIDSYIYATIAPGATGYRWKVTTMSGDAAGTIQYRNTAIRSFKITLLDSYNFNTDYKLEVAVYYGSYLQPYTASNCIVTTPSPISKLSVCTTTLNSLKDPIYLDIVKFAAGYMVKIWDPTGVATQEIPRPIRDFKMTLVNFPIQSNKLYNVQVAVRNPDGTYLPYGPICTILTPGLAKESAIIIEKAEPKTTFGVVGYPNPFNDNFNLDITTIDDAKVNVATYDMTGRKLDDFNIQVAELATLQIGNRYASGIYNIVVSQRNEVKTLRMIKR